MGSSNSTLRATVLKQGIKQKILIAAPNR